MSDPAARERRSVKNGPGALRCGAPTRTGLAPSSAGRADALSEVVLDTTSALVRAFPYDPHLQRLVDLAVQWGIRLAPSPVESQWLYHPGYRTLFVWEPDLTEQPLLYLAVILSHELGHAFDFDRQPGLREAVQELHWSEMPDSVEQSAFVQGFLLLHRLAIPVGIDAYTNMIEAPMGARVKAAVQSNWACCLLSERSVTAAAG